MNTIRSGTDAAPLRCPGACGPRNYACTGPDRPPWFTGDRGLLLPSAVDPGSPRAIRISGEPQLLEVNRLVPGHTGVTDFLRLSLGAVGSGKTGMAGIPGFEHSCNPDQSCAMGAFGAGTSGISCGRRAAPDRISFNRPSLAALAGLRIPRAAASCPCTGASSPLRNSARGSGRSARRSNLRCERG